MSYNPAYKYKKLLNNINDYTQFEQVANNIGITELLKPVQKHLYNVMEEVEQQIKNVTPFRIQSRVKSSGSILFKMLYCRKTDINLINDLIGFQVAVIDNDDVYKLFEDLVTSGFVSSVRISDTINRGSYQSLDSNFFVSNNSVQIQIRTFKHQDRYETAENHKNYKIKKFNNFKKYIEGEGIDYRVQLMEQIFTKFTNGYNIVAEGNRNIDDILHIYSSQYIDLTKIRELNITEQMINILKIK